MTDPTEGDKPKHSTRLDAILANKQPVTKTVRFPRDDGSELVFTFRSIGRKAWEELGRDHAPKPEDVREYRQRQLDRGTPPERLEPLPYDPYTYPPALLAAGCTEPGLTLDEAKALWDSDALSFAELAILLTAAQTANTDASSVMVGPVAPRATSKRTRRRTTAGSTGAGG